MAVIRRLKDRFNSGIFAPFMFSIGKPNCCANRSTEGDIDLLASDECWDPHAITGLLKTFIRELPGSIFTRELHTRFLSAIGECKIWQEQRDLSILFIDLVYAQERIKELSSLISQLPLANYSLLRALTAHLNLIVQNSNVNKMTIRNVGIVFTPTLGIPERVLSLMLGEFDRVFSVDGPGTLREFEIEISIDDLGTLGEEEGDSTRRNSRHCSDAAADQLLGLAGRSLKGESHVSPLPTISYSYLVQCHHQGIPMGRTSH